MTNFPAVNLMKLGIVLQCQIGLQKVCAVNINVLHSFCILWAGCIIGLASTCTCK